MLKYPPHERKGRGYVLSTDTNRETQVQNAFGASFIYKGIWEKYVCIYTSYTGQTHLQKYDPNITVNK